MDIIIQGRKIQALLIVVNILLALITVLLYVELPQVGELKDEASRGCWSYLCQSLNESRIEIDCSNFSSVLGEFP